jgi:hypothetical protein
MGVGRGAWKLVLGKVANSVGGVVEGKQIVVYQEA